MSNGIKDKLAGFLLGSAVGATIGFLTAPRSGDQTRSMLNEKSKETLDMVKNQYQEKLDQAEEKISDINQELSGRAEKLKKAGKKVMDREREVLNEGVEEVKQAVSK